MPLHSSGQKKKSDNGTNVRQYLIQVPVSTKNAGIVANAFRNYLLFQNNGPDACRIRFDAPCQGLRSGDISLAVGQIFEFDDMIPLQSVYFGIDADLEASVTVIEGAENRE